MMVVIAPPAAVLFDQMGDKGRRNHSAIEKTHTGEVVPDQAAQRTAEPARERNGEAAFRLAQQFRGQTMPDGPNEDPLSAAMPQFPRMRNARGERRQLMV